MNAIERLSSTDYLQDVLLLAGDVTDHIHKLQQALRVLKPKFKEIFFVPGSIDLHGLYSRKPRTLVEENRM